MARCQQTLVVDSEPWLHTDLIRALRRQNIAVLSVSTSDIALQAVGDGFAPDAVLIDFATKDPNTARLLRHVKSVHGASIIALVPDVPLARIGPTPDRYVLKPLRVHALMAILDDLHAPRRSPADQCSDSRLARLATDDPEVAVNPT